MTTYDGIPSFVLPLVHSTFLLAAERRRREEGWNDLGLDQLDRTGTALTAAGRVSSTQQG